MEESLASLAAQVTPLAPRLEGAEAQLHSAEERLSALESTPKPEAPSAEVRVPAEADDAETPADKQSDTVPEDMLRDEMTALQANFAALEEELKKLVHEIGDAVAAAEARYMQALHQRLEEMQDTVDSARSEDVDGLRAWAEQELSIINGALAE